ncbi:putative Fimbrial subunit type 1 precursor [Xenorhabdus poinarii G6]|uniref:Putative Fimbrial subunit type 1 n=1 Tax=Xenorhabdus poinarii G6 TaxID=1354304 RepID=A0A068R3J8_9GAMM|nr:fimbrial protein [Xenorhabdus poinarii]CDG21728.1 putative Fimbrial subunit type 1 precursor [Xenorhabdus poinarii G6]
MIVMDMQIKNILVSSFIAAILVSVSSISYAVSSPTTGTVEFSGRIIESTCTVNSSGNTVDMGTYLKSEIQKSGDQLAGSKRDFKIKLTGCPVDNSSPIMMDVTFSGSSKDARNQKLLALDTSSSSKGIGIGIYDKSDVPIDLSSKYSFPDAITSSDIEIPLKAAYVSNGETAQAGTANATLSFEINYK